MPVPHVVPYCTITTGRLKKFSFSSCLSADEHNKIYFQSNLHVLSKVKGKRYFQHKIAVKIFNNHSSVLLLISGNESNNLTRFTFHSTDIH